MNNVMHPLDPQPHRHSMLVPRVCAPRVTRCRLGKYWSRDFFRKRLRVVDSELAIQNLISFRCLYLGQIGCQGDGLRCRQPILGVHMLSMTHREAAIFDDACTVPTPCLLLPGMKELNRSCLRAQKIHLKLILSISQNISEGEMLIRNQPTLFQIIPIHAHFQSYL